MVAGQHGGLFHRGRPRLLSSIVSFDHERAQSITPDRTWGIRDYDVGTRDIIQVVTHPGNPWELYRSTVDGKTSVPLTTHNSAWLKEKKLSAYEPHRFETNEGIMVDYWTLKPAVFDSGKKYPLLVAIHDGPAMMWGPGEASNWFQMQFFAARGYTVMFCNPRGSSGYGRDFLRANFSRLGRIDPRVTLLFAAAGSPARNRMSMPAAKASWEVLTAVI